ncbi:hypothetical protein [[Mycoplasma] mobile]|uniref:Expressed protein n=1 Tax=Mycoplasma mobile (strain ATCC 43663 / 163K / NCTC 11711) TaxID=267748 RepID=Q6KII3_MYCM1|nr:hypothetical protein [[Mycoplasma] mobile]AAT27593.1 expressed protein [Mycoplasma mobile 163K]
MRHRKKEEEFRNFLTNDIGQYSRKELINQIKEQYKTFKKRYVVGYGIFLTLNIAIFAISSMLVVLNLFAIRLNNNQLSRPFFIAIAFITGSIAFFSSLNAFFEFKNLHKDLNDRIKMINEEMDEFKKSQTKYAKDDIQFLKLFEKIDEAIRK